MSLSESFSFLHCLKDFQQDFRFRYHSETFDLRHFRAFLKRSKIEYDTLPTILIGGSKGKGTVANFLSSLLQAHGKKIGLFLSPYLYDVTEMIRLNGKAISRARLANILKKLRGHIGGGELSFFEMMTACALQYFHEEHVDFAILEVGMGGEKDATNVTNPLLSVITSIELEHTRFLGKCLYDIVQEKVGICRSHIPVILGPNTSYVRNLVRDFVQKSPLIESNALFPYKIFSLTAQKTRFQIFFNGKFQIFDLSICGEVYVEDALLALTAASKLLPSIDFQAVRKAFVGVRLPAHFEVTRLSDNRILILDVLHTPYSARRFRQTLDRVFPKKKFCFIVGFSRDKKHRAILRSLVQSNDILILTQFSSPRCYSASLLYNFFIQNGLKWNANSKIFLEEDLSKAFQKIFSFPSQEYIFCLVGSFFLLREAKNRNLI